MSARRAIINDESSSLPTLASGFTQSSPPVVARVTMPGARRSYWRMTCETASKSVRTKEIDRENKLENTPEMESEHRTNELDELFGCGDGHEEYLSQELSSQADYEGDDNAGVQYKSKALKKVLGDTGFELSGEQKAVLNLVLNTKKNIFFTGAAGTGKSVLLRCIIALLRQQHGAKAVYVAAYTGIAACNIGGTTVHRWAGIGLGNKSVEELVKTINFNKKTKDRWKTTKVLLIDEISMLSVSLLTKLEEIARIVRKNDLPFGGIQLICTGDLFQLPPIDRVDPRFCFECDVWDKVIHRTVNLTRVFRQSESKFAEVLNEMRMGFVSAKANEMMSQLTRAPTLPKGLVPTKLFPTRSEVSRANSTSLTRLGGTEYEYACSDWKKNIPETKFIEMSKYTIADEKIQLKIGAQVMLIKNIDSTLVNGSIGRVVAFMSQDGNYDDSLYGKDMLPEHLMEVSKYSKLLGAYGDSESSKRKRKLAEAMSADVAAKEGVLPVVKFVSSNKTVRFLMVQPEVWEVSDFDGNVIASRTQIPLILAWALSIHKAQGQTLPYVSVDLRKVFEKGQSYVALSRATSLEGLQVLNFSPNVITASRVVKQFYEKLDTISSEEIEEAESFFDQTFIDHIPNAPKPMISEAQPGEIPHASNEVKLESVPQTATHDPENSFSLEIIEESSVPSKDRSELAPKAEKTPDVKIESVKPSENHDLEARKLRLASYREKQADLLKAKLKAEYEFRENQRLCEQEEHVIAQYMAAQKIDPNPRAFAAPFKIQTVAYDDVDEAMFSDVDHLRYADDVAEKFYGKVESQHQPKRYRLGTNEHYL